MYEYYPLLIVGGIIGTFSVIFILAFALLKNKKEAIGFDRQMKDGEIIRRMLKYAKPHWKSFVFVLFILLFSIAYDIISPLILGRVTDLIEGDSSSLRTLYVYVAIYGGVLVVSLVCTYVQAIVLQKIATYT